MFLHTVLQGDVLARLSRLPDSSIQCVVTSPPYYSLRSYLPDNHKDKHLEIGQESTPGQYIDSLTRVFREVYRVLRHDGILWLNLGDSYSGSSGNHSNTQLSSAKQASNKNTTDRWYRNFSSKPKDLLGIPWRVALALQSDGWYLRSAIPWLKNAVMPESVNDRPTSAIEYFFLLTKSKNYYYDHEAIKKPAKNWNTRDRSNFRSGTTDPKLSHNGLENGDFAQTGRNRRNSDWFTDSIEDILNGVSGTLLHDESNLPVAVFSNPQPYKEAHFATFSPRLITPMILAGSSHKACEICGAPWQRKTKLNRTFESGSGKAGNIPIGKRGHGLQGGGATLNVRRSPTVHSVTVGWEPTCTCPNNGTDRSVVLDPFAGSGTTLWVAESLGRNSIGVELSSKYCKLIRKRMKNMQATIFQFGVGV